MMVSEAPAPSSLRATSRSGVGQMEILFGAARVIVDASVDEAALSRVLSALAPR
jgi:hypothetical protein